MAKKEAKKKMTLGAIRAAARAGSIAISDPATTVLAAKDYKVCGVPIPFALQYLIDCSIWPLGTCMEISGESDSNKTTFMFELGRMFYQAGGWLDLILTESKYSPELAFSLMGWPEDWHNGAPLVINRSQTMEEWQAMLLKRIEMVKGWIEKGGKVKVKEGGKEVIVDIPKGAFYPVLYGIDSIMGQSLASTDKKIHEEGDSGRGFAVEAGSLTKFLKSLSAAVADYPFSVLYINHGKVDKIDDYREIYRTPGGNQTRFQALYRIRSQRLSKMVFAEDEAVAALYRRGYMLKFSMYKSSMGEGYRSITLPFYWSYRTNAENESQQYSTFDWDASLVYILLAQHRDEGFNQEARALIRKKLDAVVHVRSESTAVWPKEVWSSHFNNGEPMTPSELGKLIAENPEMIAGLRRIFGIKVYPAWDGTTDYCRLRKSLHERMVQAAVSTPA